MAQLPDDIATLKAMVLEQQHQRPQTQQEIDYLRERLRLLMHKRFGASSEQSSPDQLGLFQDSSSDERSEAQCDTSSTMISAYAQQKPKRRPLPDYLEREEIIHDLPEEEKHCPHDGATLQRMGEVISEQLDMIPAKVHVMRHVRYTYACPCCGQTIKTAELAPQPLPKSQASPGSLAHIAVSKYGGALPLYRQAQILQRCQDELSRADPDHRIILYEYDPLRSAQVPERLFEGYKGYLQTDSYERYSRVTAREGVMGVECWAHVRRKFDEAVKARAAKQLKGGKATKATTLNGKLFRIERDTKMLSPQQRYALRQERAAPVLDEIRDWLDASLPSVPPKSLTGQALYYLHKQWPRLTRYLQDGRIAIDTNIAENAIRPFVMGRKNWLFSTRWAACEPLPSSTA